jgi:hypothetical protein
MADSAQFTGTAINFARTLTHLTGTQRARTRTRQFPRLRPADQNNRRGGVIKALD